MRTDVGRYTVREGDNLQIISQRVYGSTRRAAEIAKANTLSVEPTEGMILNIPGFEGVTTTVQGDEGITGLFVRVKAKQITAADIKEFERWNGKQTWDGQEVFLVNMRRKSYGY